MYDVVVVVELTWSISVTLRCVNFNSLATWQAVRALSPVIITACVEERKGYSLVLALILHSDIFKETDILSLFSPSFPFPYSIYAVTIFLSLPIPSSPLSLPSLFLPPIFSPPSHFPSPPPSFYLLSLLPPPFHFPYPFSPDYLRHGSCEGSPAPRPSSPASEDMRWPQTRQTPGRTPAPPGSTPAPTGYRSVVNVGYKNKKKQLWG